ncbi:MAG: hypothetical protein Unbinned1469contig1000_49 [Prokaryotic dsDNA virus sp.]|jgi:hypothetical protein|nr:MAG: hypothetical protein Unbinned1469contig1000_49 [Prokaryotic dsDNA virus sp.]|tara:strand:- start:6177 stop:6674 length:498 start_codon:yes stop_codon:yes gene_type:complete
MDKNSWDREKNETQKAFYAFGLYRDMGYTRSLPNVAKLYAEETGRKESTILSQLKRWSAKYNWVKRCEEFDIEQDRIYQLENKEKLKQMRERHLTFEVVKQTKGFEKIRNLRSEELEPREALALLDSGIRGERTLHGEPESTLGIQAGGLRKIKVKWSDEIDEDE